MQDVPEMKAVFGDRSLFPDLEPRVYLNHAAISPPSLAVRAAVDQVMGDYARTGTGASPVRRIRRAGVYSSYSAMRLVRACDAREVDKALDERTKR